jgi:hypothetical protein
MFEGFTVKELLRWIGGILVAAAIVIFGAIWATDAFLEGSASDEPKAEMSGE